MNGNKYVLASIQINVVSPLLQELKIFEEKVETLKASEQKSSALLRIAKVRLLHMFALAHLDLKYLHPHSSRTASSRRRRGRSRVSSRTSETSS